MGDSAAIRGLQSGQSGDAIRKFGPREASFVIIERFGSRYICSMGKHVAHHHLCLEGRQRQAATLPCVRDAGGLGIFFIRRTLSGFVSAGVAEQEVSGDDDDDQQGHEGHGRIRAIGGHLLVQPAKEEGPAQYCGIGPGQNDGHIEPDGQAQQEPDHGADDGTGHPEGKPDESKQPDDPVLLDLLFMPLGGLVRTLHYPLEPFEN